MSSHRHGSRPRLSGSLRKVLLLLGAVAGVLGVVSTSGAGWGVAWAAREAGHDGGTAYEEYTGGNHAVYQKIVWTRASGEQGVGLFLFRVAELGFTQRLFVRAPGGRHLILERTLTASAGLERTRLVDDESGWWLEVTKDYGLTASGLRKFFSIAEDFVAGSGKTVGYTLRTREGLEWKAEIPAQQAVEEQARLAAALRGTELGGVLERHVETDLAEAMTFLGRETVARGGAPLGR